MLQPLSLHQKPQSITNFLKAKFNAFQKPINQPFLNKLFHLHLRSESVKSDCQNVVSLLLQKGADLNGLVLNGTLNDGKTIFMDLCEKGSLESVNCLLKYETLDVKKEDRFGQHALHYLLRRVQLENTGQIITKVLRKGGEQMIRRKDRNEKDVLMMVGQRLNPQFVKILLEKKFHPNCQSSTTQNNALQEIFLIQNYPSLSCARKCLQLLIEQNYRIANGKNLFNQQPFDWLLKWKNIIHEQKEENSSFNKSNKVGQIKKEPCGFFCFSCKQVEEKKEKEEDIESSCKEQKIKQTYEKKINLLQVKKQQENKKQNGQEYEKCQQFEKIDINQFYFNEVKNIVELKRGRRLEEMKNKVKTIEEEDILDEGEKIVEKCQCRLSSLLKINFGHALKLEQNMIKDFQGKTQKLHIQIKNLFERNLQKNTSVKGSIENLLNSLQKLVSEFSFVLAIYGSLDHHTWTEESDINLTLLPQEEQSSPISFPLKKMKDQIENELIEKHHVQKESIRYVKQDRYEIFQFTFKKYCINILFEKQMSIYNTSCLMKQIYDEYAPFRPIFVLIKRILAQFDFIEKKFFEGYQIFSIIYHFSLSEKSANLGLFLYKILKYYSSNNVHKIYHSTQLLQMFDFQECFQFNLDFREKNLKKIFQLFSLVLYQIEKFEGKHILSSFFQMNKIVQRGEKKKKGEEIEWERQNHERKMNKKFEEYLKKKEQEKDKKEKVEVEEVALPYDEYSESELSN